MKKFKEILMQDAIPIYQMDQFCTPLREFDEVHYQHKTYLITWHPIYNQFVGCHESGDWIPNSKL